MICEHGNLGYECGLCVPPSQDAHPKDIFSLERKKAENARNQNLCACGCGKPHYHSISSPVLRLDGTRALFWYASTTCQFKHRPFRNKLHNS